MSTALANLQGLIPELLKGIAQIAQRLDTLDSTAAPEKARALRAALDGENFIVLDRKPFPVDIAAAEALVDGAALLAAAGKSDSDSNAVPLIVVVLFTEAVWNYIQSLADAGDEKAAWQLTRRQGARVLSIIDDDASPISDGLTLLGDQVPFLRRERGSDYDRIGLLIGRIMKGPKG